jgi:tetratricopeptide (TPR) repeat protein
MKITALFFFISNLIIAQQLDGYWDKERITNKEVKLSAGERIIIKSEDFPVGTTEFVYRITLLDENQKMANDLASVLKAIPDPYFIGKGKGGAISLVSAISGNDKCTYAIFSNNDKAIDFGKNANVKLACLYQNNPVSKDAKVVSVEKSTCLKDDSQNVWFGFENKNWLMGEKIVLEIVPWVDVKASKIWNQSNKKTAIAFLKSTEIASKLPDSDNFCYNLFEKIQKEYKFVAFQKLSIIEKNALVNKFSEVTLSETNNLEIYTDIVRDQAKKLFQSGKYDQAIMLINNKLIGKPKTTALDCNSVAELYICTKQFEKALKSLKNAEKIDSSELLVQLNLAHTYMFLNKMSESRVIHKKFMDQNVSATVSWKTKTQNDLEEFRKLNLAQDNFKKILRLLD